MAPPSPSFENSNWSSSNCIFESLKHTNLERIAVYASLINKSITTKQLKLGKLIHSLLIKTSLNLNAFLANRLIHMYAISDSMDGARRAFQDLPIKNAHSWNTILSAHSRIGLVDHARHLFDEMPEPNLVSYNSMISGLTHHGHHGKAIEIFHVMQKQSGRPMIDKFTLVGVASACAGLAVLELLRQIHSVVIAIGLELNLIMYNALIDAYGKCGDVDASRWLFHEMPERDVVSWTSMVVAYARACKLEEACWVFDRMPVRNAVSWTALIAGHAQNRFGSKALDLFAQMQKEGILPSAFTFVSVLSACANLALIERGKQLHGHISRNTILNVFIYNALIDMYAKCGEMSSATKVFEKMPKRDIITWNALVSGFAQNGYVKQSLAVFKRMSKEGVRPNHVTFLGVLSACSHAGLVSEGRQLFDSMESVHGVCPMPEHYAIMIDILGRNCQLKEAMELIELARMESDSIGMWGALLGACRVHGNLDFARQAAESLFELEPSNAARYVMLSNIYAAAGRWDESRRVRGLMRERGLRKEPACSWIEVRNGRHGFLAEDKSHQQAEEIYEMLAKLADQMKLVGYDLENSQNFIFDED